MQRLETRYYVFLCNREKMRTLELKSRTILISLSETLSSTRHRRTGSDAGRESLTLSSRDGSGSPPSRYSPSLSS